MKRVILMLVCVLIGLASCQKDVEPETHADKVNQQPSHRNGKSLSTREDSIFSAMGVKEILYNGTYSYDVSFDNASNVSIIIGEFDLDGSIKFILTYQNQSSNVNINPNLNGVRIGSSIFMYDSIEELGISQSTDVRLRAVLAIIIHHAKNPGRDLQVTNDPHIDKFPNTIDQIGWCFWCNEVSYSPCQEGLFRWQFTRRHRIFIDFGVSSEAVPC